MKPLPRRLANGALSCSARLRRQAGGVPLRRLWRFSILSLDCLFFSKDARMYIRMYVYVMVLSWFYNETHHFKVRRRPFHKLRSGFAEGKNKCPDIFEWKLLRGGVMK